MPMRRPEEFSHFEACLDDIKIHYVREGRGPPLMLMHGWPGFWWEGHKCIGALAQDFDVIAPDMRSYGDSDKPGPENASKYDLSLVTDDHAKLLRHLGISRAYVVGHDYSSLVMHKFVRLYRHVTIRGLTIDPVVPGQQGKSSSVANSPPSWCSPRNCSTRCERGLAA